MPLATVEATTAKNTATLKELTQPAKDILEYIAQCNGFENHYRHWLKRLTYSEGVKFVADTAGAYWLIDAIVSHQTARVIRECDGFQVWTLRKNKTGNGARLICTDGGKDGEPARQIVCQRIEYTDFPLSEIGFYVENGILFLQAER